MKTKLNILLKCFSIYPVLDDIRNFQWLGTSILLSQQPILEINNKIEFIMINIKQIKLPIDILENDDINIGNNYCDIMKNLQFKMVELNKNHLFNKYASDKIESNSLKRIISEISSFKNITE